MGSFFQLGEQKIRPGTFIRYENRGGISEAAISRGIVAAVIKADWGPLGQVIDVLDNSKEKIYGNALTTYTLTDIFKGGKGSVAYIKTVRLGSGGTKGSYNLKDTTATPIDVLKIEAKYPGTKPLKITTRDSLTDTTKKEVLIYDGAVLKQTITFAKGAGEVDALIATLATVGSDWITINKIAAGNGTLANVTQQALAGGTNPVITNADYSNAFALLEPFAWDVICLDTDDTAVQALVQAFVDRVVSDGKLCLCVVGQPTSVAFATRKTSAASYNSMTMVYVLSGFVDNGIVCEGHRAAARVAGMIAGSASNESLTHAIIPGANTLVETLTNPQIEQALQSGAIVFTTNAYGQVQVEYGINTLISLSANQDAGWKKIRRVKTRFELIERITAIWDTLVGKVNNDPNGRATLIAAAQGIINKMASEGKLLPGGEVYEDIKNTAQGDSAWFECAVDDLDSAEKIYLGCGFQFAPLG